MCQDLVCPSAFHSSQNVTFCICNVHFCDSFIVFAFTLTIERRCFRSMPNDRGLNFLAEVKKNHANQIPTVRTATPAHKWNKMEIYVRWK